MSRRRKKTPPAGAPLKSNHATLGRKWLALVFLVALAYRGTCFAAAGGHPLYRYPVVDAGHYHAWAQRITAGDWLGHGPDDVFKPPFYAYFLAGLYGLFGTSVALIQWVQFFLGACSCVLVAVLAGRLLGQATGRVVGLLSAGYAPYVFFESQLLTPALSIFLNLAALLVLISPQKAPRPRRLFAAGAIFGLSAGVRPDVLLPAGLVTAYVLLAYRPIRTRQLAVGGLCAVLGVAAVLAPITVRNYDLTGQLIPISSNAGINFYVGNSAAADGITAVPVGLRWERLVARVPQEVLEQPAAASRWWVCRAWEEIRGAPGSALLRLGRKGLAFFNRREFRNNICYHFMQRRCLPLRLSPLQFWVILPLAACGLVKLFRAAEDRQRRALAVCLLWVGGYWLVGMVFFVTARFRLPAVPLLMLAAGWGLMQIAHALHRWQWKALLGYAAVVLLAGMVCWPVRARAVQNGWVRDHVNLGNSLRQGEQPQRALDSYRRALAIQPSDPDAHYLSAGLLLPARPADALVHLESARRAVPDSPDVLLTTATAHLGRRDAAGARRALNDILQLATTSNLMPKRAAWATAHVLLARLNPEAAADHWQKAWSIDPRTAAEAAFLQRRELNRVLETFRTEAARNSWDWYCRANYGTALLELGRAEEAIGAFRAASRLAPQREALRFHLARALLRANRKAEAAEILQRLHDELPPCRLRDQAAELRDRIRGEF